MSTRPIHADLETVCDAEDAMTRYTFSRASRFSHPGQAKGYTVTAETFIAHAKANLQAAVQNLRRAEREQPDITRGAASILALALEHLESLQSACPASARIRETRDEEEE